MFDDIEKYMKVPHAWSPPETKPYTPGVISISLLGVCVLLVGAFNHKSFEVFLHENNVRVEAITDIRSGPQFLLR